MRSLLVALDETPCSDAAVQFSLALAIKQHAAVTGPAIIDVDYLTAPEPGAIGAAYYKYKADVARLKQAHDQGERVIRTFLDRCGAKHISGNVLSVEGNPADELRDALSVHDALVIGRDSDCHGEPADGFAGTIEQILKSSPRPLVVTPERVGDLTCIVIAYDGSAAAAKALQMVTLLGLAKDNEVHVVSVNPEREAAARCAGQAGSYLTLYGIPSRIHALVSRADPIDLVVAEANSVGANLLVMGAYGHRGWREALLGSFTTRMLLECPTALFIHH